MRERERERERERDRDRDRDRDTQRDTEIDRDRDGGRQRDIERERDRERKRGTLDYVRQAERKKEKSLLLNKGQISFTIKYISKKYKGKTQILLLPAALCRIFFSFFLLFFFCFNNNWNQIPSALSSQSF